MPRVAAFFDLDRTLVACNTGRLFVKDLRARGEISFLRAARAMGWMAKYYFSLIDLDLVAGRAAALLAGRTEAEFAERCRRWAEDVVLPRLLPAALRNIDRHRRDGHLLALLTTSPSYVARPVAETLGLDETIATQLEVEDGRFTGRLLGPCCFGQGKVRWAEDVGRKHDLDFAASWFYTDSYSDLPMLERVGNRVVVNPDPRLRRTARERGWPVESWAKSRTADTGSAP